MIQIRTCDLSWPHPFSHAQHSRHPSPVDRLTQIHIRATALPLSCRSRYAIRVLLHATLNIVHCELALELALERRDHPNQVRASLLEDGRGRDRSIRLDLEEEVWVERMRDLVAGKEDVRVPQELSTRESRGTTVLGNLRKRNVWRRRKTYERRRFASV